MENFDIISNNVIFYLLKYLDNYSVSQATKRVVLVKRSVTQVLCKGDMLVQCRRQIEPLQLFFFTVNCFLLRFRGQFSC